MITLTSNGPCAARGFGALVGSPATDPYFAYVTLLMHCDGVNTGTTFTDNSNTAHTLTASGNTVTSSAQFKFGNASLRTRSAGAQVTCSNTGFDFGTADFTVECWYYLDGVFAPDALSGIFSNSSARSFFAGFGSSTNNLIFYGAAGPTSTTGWAHGMASSAWNHIAWVRNGANRTIYVNGNSIGTAADVSGVSFSPIAGTAYIASSPASGTPTIYGYADEFRITKGIARYTSNFTPPNSPFPNS